MTYRKAGKQEAYETALAAVTELDDTSADDALDQVIDIVRESASDKLTDFDIRDVAAKALRVERGERIREGYYTTSPIHLGTGEEGALREAAAREMAAEAGFTWGGEGSIGRWLVAQIDEWIEQKGQELIGSTVRGELAAASEFVSYRGLIFRVSKTEDGEITEVHEAEPIR
jgi:hypothetical protein